jgi:hypothetical protein
MIDAVGQTSAKVSPVRIVRVRSTVASPLPMANGWCHGCAAFGQRTRVREILGSLPESFADVRRAFDELYRLVGH